MPHAWHRWARNTSEEGRAPDRINTEIQAVEAEIFFILPRKVESAQTPARSSGTAGGASNPVSKLKPFFPLRLGPIRSPWSSAHPLVCLSRMERSYISALHHSTVSLRHLIETLNGMHDAQLSAPRLRAAQSLHMCVSGWEKNGTTADTCTIIWVWLQSMK